MLRRGKHQRDGQGESLARSSLWNIAAQFSTAALSLAIVPLLISRLGISAYGVYSLGITGISLIQQLDGGLINSSTRYIAVYKGAEDYQRVTQLVLTIGAAVLIGGGIVALVIAIGAGVLVDVFHIPITLHSQARFYFATIAVLLPLGLIQAVTTSILQAHARFRLLSSRVIVLSILRAGAIVILIHHHNGLKTMAFLLVGYQVMAWLFILPAAASYLRREHFSLMTKSETVALFRYSIRVQIANATAVVNLQADVIIIGLFLPIREVALYTTGANLALQIRGILTNALFPMGVRLATVFGTHDEDAVLDEMARLQRNWVFLNTGLFFVAMGASVFVVENWLGSEFFYSGIVCLVLLAGYMINMFTGVLTLFLNSVGRPGVVARYSLIAMVLNVALTVPMVFAGLLGIVGATSVGLIVGSIYLISIARRRVRRDIPSFLAEVPWWQGAIAGLISTGSCAALRGFVNLHGALGMLFCALGTVPGLIFFSLATLGWKSSLMLISRAKDRLLGGGPQVTSLEGPEPV